MLKRTERILAAIMMVFGLEPGVMAGEKADLDTWVGRAVDIAPSANPRLAAYDTEKDWFSLGGFAYLLAIKSQANINLQADDIPLFLP